MFPRFLVSGSRIIRDLLVISETAVTDDREADPPRKQIAATLTNPFDVVKTRRQAAADAGAQAAPASSNRTFTLLRTIVKQEGYAGLFSGLTPRLAKVGLGSQEPSRVSFGPLLEKAELLTRKDHHRNSCA